MTDLTELTPCVCGHAAGRHMSECTNGICGCEEFRLAASPDVDIVRQALADDPIDYLDQGDLADHIVSALAASQPPSGDARCSLCGEALPHLVCGGRVASGDAPDLREALRAFGERLAADGYGWEAIITRETPSGEQTVAHLTTANPDPDALAASQPPSGDLVDDLRAEFDQGHFMPWDEIIARVLASQPPSGDAHIPCGECQDKGYQMGFDMGRESMQPTSGDAPDLREALEMARLSLKGAQGLALDNDESDFDAEFTRTIGIIDAALAASAPSSPATPAPLEHQHHFEQQSGHVHCVDCEMAFSVAPAPLDVDAVAAFFEGYLEDERPWVRTFAEAFCRYAPRAYANQEGGDCEHGIPRNECKLAEHDR